MATLATDLTVRLRQTVKDQELRFRNRSGSDGWIFSIYADGDAYIGCVELIEASRTLRVHEGRIRICRQERERLEALCAAFNRL